MQSSLNHHQASDNKNAYAERRFTGPQMNSIIDYLEQWAAVQPNKCVYNFLDAGGKQRAGYTYFNFANRTRTLAKYLSGPIGLKYGDRVLLVYPPGLEVIVAFYACVRVGVIPVPVPSPSFVNFEPDLARLVFVAEDCHAKAVLTTQEYYRSYGLRLATRKPPPFPKTANTWPALEWFATDDVTVQATDGFHNTPNDILFLQYTSGSTSDPKGVMVSHQNVINNALSTVDHVPVGVSWLPQYHDMGLIGFYLFPLIFGGTTYGFAPTDFLKRPILWLETMSRVRATCSSSPNFGFEYCLREDRVPSRELDRIDLSSLRVLMNASEPVRADTYLSFLQRFTRCGLQPESYMVGYGLAENTLAATNWGRRIITVNKRLFLRGVLHIDNASHPANNTLCFVSSGKPLEGVQLRIVNSESRTALGEREIGEIWLSGKSLCQGYWRRPQLTRKVFCNILSNDPEDNNVYLRSGDLGFQFEGELFICGRIKDLIIFKGVNYYPQDIEAIVESTSSKIRPGGVAAFNGADEETLVVAVEIRNGKKPPDAIEIARAIRTLCYVAPHTILFVPSRTIVRTTSGKTARSLTRQRFLDGTLPVIATYLCANQQQHVEHSTGLRERFRYLVKMYNLSDRKEYTFAEVGMDSLTLVEFLLDIKQMLQEAGAIDLVDAVDVQLLQQLTVAELFDLLDQWESMPDQTIAAWHHVLRRTRQEYETHVQDCMRSDAIFESNNRISATPHHEPLKNVLMTGATGFFGPFLLNSLLLHTPYTYYVLTRAPDPMHGLERIRNSLRRSLLWTPSIAAELEKRVHVVCGDIARPNLGLDSEEWKSLAARIHSICHNAALVNYIFNYEMLKPHNVDGTRELLRLSFAGRRKEFHYISSTFIFGWTVKGMLMEDDSNPEMTKLDFGYAQSKWVAEQLVFAAEKQGLRVRVYRPSLITASTRGSWDRNDIAIRLLVFMIKHGVAVYSENQVSFLPADIVADNIACIFTQQDITARTLHVTADDYYNMTDITRLISSEYGYRFEYYDIPGFIGEMNRRCTSDDPLYPLLDFFNRSYWKIAAMQLKRYSNEQYRKAREQSGRGRWDPPLRDTVSYLMAYMLGTGLVSDAASPSVVIGR
jgi:thioester reductase-like protein